MKKATLVLAIITAAQVGASAQQMLTLDDCHQMAVENSRELDQARQKIRMAEYDKKIAAANYLPSISATGTYMYNSHDIALLSDEASSALQGMGDAVQSQISGQMQQLMTAIKTNPAAAQEYMTSPMWQTVIGALSQTDVSAALNQIGTSISEAFNLDMSNIYAGVISVQQPLFVGGKIIASNKMAALARDLSHVQYDLQYEDLLITVDEAYWQIVSVAQKKRLAEAYSDMLADMVRNAEISVAEGIVTQSDLLAVKVKHNEARLLYSKAANGLSLSKMLLCKQIGLPLDSDIVLADERDDEVPVPAQLVGKDMDSIISDRPETRSLELASAIYDQKVKIAKADMMPKVALSGNYVVSNPSMYNGFQKEFGGTFTAGVMVSVPLFHGTEALQKTRKAKAEAAIYKSRYDDACEMINLQVEQLVKQRDEALERLRMAESALDSAEENLRAATIGFDEGIVNANTTLQAQTAWMQAHSEYIDAGVELQMNHSKLLKAQGEYMK